jgi:hypothetical protein
VTKPDRNTAIDAVDTLNDLMGDLVAATQVLQEYMQRYQDGSVNLNQMSAVQKMCLSHLILALSKQLEFWRRYQIIVPAKHRSELEELNDSLRRKGVLDLRNKVAAHIWDTKQRRPLRHSEIKERLEDLTGASLGEFLRWVNNPKDNSYPTTVLSIIETLRDSLVAEHSIQIQEVIER